MSTGIEWTNETWNPTSGCDRVSPGCDNCYALGMAKRLKAMSQPDYQTDGDPKTSGPGFGLATHPHRLDQPLRWKKPRKVFVNSMSDLFHDQVPDEFIARVFAVMHQAPQHTFQILTKRHGRLRSLLSSSVFAAAVVAKPAAWPLPNVWLGVSVENQKWADIRVPALLDTPAAVRFLSCEPLLSPVNLAAWMTSGRARWQCSGCRRFYAGDHRDHCPGCDRVGYWSGSHTGNSHPNGQPINWVIVGGESGPRARPMHPDWARSLRDQCADAGVPFFLKQTGTKLAREWGIGGKGHDPALWPEPFPQKYPEPALA